MTDLGVRLADEFRQAPQAVERQAQDLAQPLAELVARLRRRPPQVVVTCARGSSAHAAAFAKFLIERHLGIPVAPAAPSIVTIYGRHLRLENQLFLAISQSGRSDDLIEQAMAAQAAGALTAALVNDPDSPLARACEVVLPIAAGAERSIAATKTFVATLSALLRWTASWAEDDALRAALARLPDRLAAAADQDWSAALRTFAANISLVTIGRGPTLAVAREAALKLKEVCNLHAEAFSGAEFLHGPVALVSLRYPILLLMPTDAAAAGLQRLAEDLRRKGAAVFCAEPGEPSAERLPALAADHPETDAVCLIQSFYAMLIRLAELLGTDLERPRHLEKITRTR
jgi:glucosamine--fructose-6-phosphate aminotransferase (isomerizing)